MSALSMQRALCRLWRLDRAAWRRSRNRRGRVGRGGRAQRRGQIDAADVGVPRDEHYFRRNLGRAARASTDCLAIPRRSSAISISPQGRRILPNLTRQGEPDARRGDAAARAAGTCATVYDLFPVLEERARSAGGMMLSGGQQQMLAIGRALMANPDLLLLDEPSEGLSPVLVDELVRGAQRDPARGHRRCSSSNSISVWSGERPTASSSFRRGRSSERRRPPASSDPRYQALDGALTSEARKDDEET